MIMNEFLSSLTPADYLGILTVPIAPLIHEFGHWFVARLFGKTIKFEFTFGKIGPIKIPRWTWKHPDLPRDKLRLVCLAGFGLELAIIPFMPLAYQLAAVAHLMLYPFYSGSANDFKY